MGVYLSPVGSATAPAANELRVLAVYKEKLCNKYCVNATMQPQVTVNYVTGTPRLVDTTVFVPITATMSIVTSNGCCNANTTLRTETYLVAFQGYTALPTSVTVENLGRDIQPANVNCSGWTNSITINDSLLITIVPAAAPATA